MYDNITDYIRELQLTLDILPRKDIAEMARMLHDARNLDNQIFIIGNGGSAATASHMATDLAKRGFKAISLNDNTPLVTALANDEGYENVFAKQLEPLINRDDILIAISVSGNSKNILKALKLAKKREAFTLCLLGGFGRGKAVDMALLSIIVPSEDYGIVEDAHLAINHMVVSALDFSK